MVRSRHVTARSGRDTVLGWLLIAAAAVIAVAGVAGLILFPIPHGAGFWERLPHLPVFVSGSVAVAVGGYGVRVLRRRSAPEVSSDRTTADNRSAK